MVTTTFWRGPAGHGPSKRMAWPSKLTALSADWSQTMSARSSVKSVETRTSVSR